MNRSINWKTFSKNQFPARSLKDAQSVASHWVVPDETSLTDFAESTGILSEPVGTEQFTFIDNVAHSAPAMHDLSVLEHKSQQCFREMFDNLSSGRAEFGNVIAYTYALLSAKTILAYLGIYFVRSRGKNWVFDFIPQFGERDHQKIYSNAKKTIANPIKIVFAGTKDITHADIWVLISALARKKNLTDRAFLDRWLSRFIYGRESLIRNKLLYRSGYWPLQNIKLASVDQTANVTQFFWEVARGGQVGPLADYYLSLRCMQILKSATR